MKPFFDTSVPNGEGASSIILQDIRAASDIRPASRNSTRPPDEDQPWTKSKNDRRCDLIDRKYAGTLGSAEAEELAELQKQMLQHLQIVAPLPLEDARRQYQELLARSASRPPTA
jgi:hypothetical protein